MWEALWEGLWEGFSDTASRLSRVLLTLPKSLQPTPPQTEKRLRNLRSDTDPCQCCT